MNGAVGLWWRVTYCAPDHIDVARHHALWKEQAHGSCDHAPPIATLRDITRVAQLLHESLEDGSILLQPEALLLHTLTPAEVRQARCYDMESNTIAALLERRQKFRHLEIAAWPAVYEE